MKPITIYLFGAFEVFVEGTPLRKLRTQRGQTVLALLALRLGKPVDRTNLATTIWPDSELADALYSLRRTLSDIRAALGTSAAALVSPSTSSIQLDPGLVWVDVGEFEMHVASSNVEGLSRAVTLYRGPLLNEWRHEWIALERSQRERSLLETLNRKATSFENLEDFSAAEELLRLMATLDPHSEFIFRRLVNILVKRGNTAGVQRAYDEFRKRLKQDLDILPNQQTQDMLREVLATSARQVESSRFVGGNLPVSRTPLIGRRVEFDRIIQALSDSRLVTLVGPGGVGKTRLGLEVIREISNGTGPRALAVDLLAVREPEQLYEALASSVKSIDPDSNSSPALIAQRIGIQEGILLLDNCEHLLDPVKQIVEDILENCPNIRMLCTSQASIGVSGEVVVRIQPMSVPIFSDISFSEALENDAINLLSKCIARAKGGFELTEKNYRSVCRICGTLEGLPLALELAATRTRLISLDQVADLLEDRFRLLKTSDRGIEERHRTLLATMDWSYSLLSEMERELLQTVSIFAGPWTSESATKIHHKLDAYTVIDILERLVDRSLILTDPSEDLPRFRLLDSVRQYALEKLTEHGLYEQTRTAHLIWFSDLCRLGEKGFVGKDQKFWMDRITAEYENVPAAIAWAKGSADRLPYALKMASSLMRYWWTRGELTVGRETVNKLLECAEKLKDTPAYARGLYAAGTLAWSQGDNSEAEELQLQALKTFEAYGEVENAASCLRNLSQAVRNQGRLEEALNYGQRALEGFRSADNEILAALTLTDLGIAASDLLLFEQGCSYFQQAIDFSCKHEIPSLEAVALLNYGVIRQGLGQLAEAQLALERTLTILDRIGGRIMTTMTRNTLASVYAELGDIRHAQALVADSLETFSELGERKGICLTLETVATVALWAQAFEIGATLLGTADQMRADLNIPHSPAEMPEHLRMIQMGESRMGLDLFRSTYDAGRAASHLEQVQLANRWLKP